jgi:hypothetical protein
VFEDQLRGMVSYRDENGEMIWEGYDEGPNAAAGEDLLPMVISI